MRAARGGAGRGFFAASWPRAAWLAASLLGPLACSMPRGSGAVAVTPEAEKEQGPTVAFAAFPEPAGRRVPSGPLEVVLQQGHNNTIYALDVSPDGRYIVSASADRSARVWELRTGRLVRILPHDDHVTAARFIADGERVVTGSGRRVRVFAWRTGARLRELQLSGALFALMPDRRRVLAYDSGEEQISLWGLDGEASPLAVGRVSSQPGTIAVSAGGRRAAFDTFDRRLEVWDLEQKRLLRRIDGVGYNRPLVVTEDGERVIVGQKDAIQIWSVATGQLEASLPVAGEVRSLAVRGSTLASSVYHHKEQLQLWDLGAKGERLRAPVEADALAFHPSGKTLIAGRGDFAIDLVSLTTGRRLYTIEGRGSWDEVWGVVAGRDGGLVAVDKYPSHAYVWALGEARPVRWFTGDGYLRPVAFAMGGDRLLLQDRADGLYGFDAARDRLDPLAPGKSDGMHQVAVSPDGRFVVNARLGSAPVVLRAVGTNDVVHQFAGATAPVAFSPDGRFLATAFVGEALKMKAVGVWDLAFGRSLRRWDAHEYTINALAWSPDGAWLLTGADDNLGKIWDASTGALRHTLAGHKGDVLAVAVAPDGSVVATSGEDGVVRLWDPRTGKERGELLGHAGMIRALRFLPGGAALFSGGHDSTVRLWDLVEGKERARLLNFGPEYAVLVDGRYYSVSRNAMRNVHFVVDGAAFGFEQFDVQFNRPDLVLERLGHASPRLVEAYRRAWEKRVRRLGFDPARAGELPSFEVPEILLPEDAEHFAETSDPSYRISFRAWDASFPLDRLIVEVNGVPIHGARGKSLAAAGTRDAKLSETIPLSAGRNAIRLAVVNQRGVASFPVRFEVTYAPTAPPRPDLHVFAVGVSKFADASFNLSWADKDARDLVALLGTRRERYGRVVAHTLTNEEVTRGRILALRAELERTRVDDEVVFFVASHGVLDEDLNYFVAMHDMDFAEPGKAGLAYEDLEALLDGIPARKKLLLLDACHSGEVDKEEVVVAAASPSPEAPGVKSRGFKVVRPRRSGLSEADGFELMKALFADLRRNNGAVVVSSAAGKEYAFEGGDFRNGVFTYALIDGLRSGRADLNKDGQVTVGELGHHVHARVKALTQGKQSPTSRQENLELDFPIW